MKSHTLLASLLLVLFSNSWSLNAAAAAESVKPELLVYAAASLTNALEAVSQSYQAAQQQTVKQSFAASSALAKQIEAGARADVFISADTDWMDYLQSRNLIQPATRRNLLGNQLVLIAPATSAVALRIGSRFTLQEALGKGRLSIGDPDSVPAGKYARAALTSLNVWNSISNQLVLGDSVRTTLNFVATGDAPLGIVYATDARIESRVRIVDVFPDSTHAPIVYPVALTRTAQPGALQYLNYLRSAEAQAIFQQQGFTVLP